MGPRRILAVAVAVVLVAVLVACGDDGDDDAATPADTVALFRGVTGEEWLDLSGEQKRAIAEHYLVVAAPTEAPTAAEIVAATDQFAEDFGPDFAEGIPVRALIDFALGAARDGPPLGTGTGTETTGG